MVRKARLDDVQPIFDLVEYFAKKGVMLYRPASEICESLRDFFVYEESGMVVGIAALHICGTDLGEIRSLAVREDRTRRGIGSRLVKACIDEAKTLGIKRVFALTYKTKFFERSNFRVVEKIVLPQKIWGDCFKCVKFPSCDETAVMMEIR